MAKFCMKCGAKLEENVKFCMACGTPVGGTAKNTAARQATNEAASGSGTARQAKAVPAKSQNSGKLLITVLVLIIILLCGGGGYYYYHSRQSQGTEAAVETTSETGAEDSKTSVTEIAEKGREEQAGTTVDSKNSPLKKAVAEMEEYGIGGKLNFIGTSYGHSSDGFIAVTDSGLVAVVDRKNHRAGMVRPRMSLPEFQQQRKAKSPSPMLMDCIFANDARDNDHDAGYWQGNTHYMTIYALYKFDGNGNLVPGMLTTGRGEKPSHYQEVLYEVKNVDFANLFLTEAISIKL